jgi:predicted DNA-binding transcriptional regulator YafY
MGLHPEVKVPPIMSNKIKDHITGAIFSGQPLRIIYNGGSQAGRVREIAPVDLSDDEVRAVCLATKRVKTYKLSRMELPQKGFTDEQYAPKKILPEPTSLEDALEPYRPEIESMGWTLKVEKDFSGVFRCFKNGKLRKTPDVYIEFHEYTVDICFDEAGQEVEERRLSARPWYVSHKRKTGSTFKNLGAAAEKFVLNMREEAVVLGLANAS